MFMVKKEPVSQYKHVAHCCIFNSAWMMLEPYGKEEY